MRFGSGHVECSNWGKVSDSIANMGSGRILRVRASNHSWHPRHLALMHPIRLSQWKVPDNINYILILIKFILHGAIDLSVNWCTYSNVFIYLFIFIQIKELCTLVNWLSTMNSLRNASNSISHYSNCWCKNLLAPEKLESGKPRSPSGPAKEV